MNILIIDDDLALLRSLEIVLTEHGHHVTCFSDPVTASLYVAEKPDIDMLLIDFMMGEMNGDELLKIMGRQLSRYCKTIMITGHREEIQSSKILQALGVRLVLCKPLDLDQICELATTN